MSDRAARAPRHVADTTVRALPANLDAEQAILGAALLQADAFDRASAVVRPEHFFRAAHARIFRGMATLVAQRIPVDFVTLCAVLRRTGELDEVGGPAYVSSLVNGLPQAVNVAEYAKLVREQFLLRDLIATATTMTQDAYEASRPAAEIYRRADQHLLEMHLGSRDTPLTDIRTRTSALLADLEHLHAHKGTLLGIPTGFSSVDEQTQGWQPGDLIIIAARPSIGKTAFMLNSMIAAGRAGKKPAIFSLEMRRQQLERRLLAALSGVPLSKIQTGYLSDVDYQGLSHALVILGDLPLYINDRMALTMAEIRLACRRQRHDHGLDLVAVDYIQLMPGSLERRGASRNEELGDISSRLKWLAGELEVPVMVLSQLKRIGHTRPTLEDLRDSGTLEQDADLVCFLHRKNHKESGITNFILEKQRNGPTGTVNLSIDRDIQRFTDAGQQTQEQVTEADREDREAVRTRAIIRQRAKRP